MEIKVLKDNIHQMVDQIQSQQLLEEFFQEMKAILHQTNSTAWDALKEEQKKEVILSYEESDEDENLLDHETVMSKYRK